MRQKLNTFVWLALALVFLCICSYLYQRSYVLISKYFLGRSVQYDVIVVGSDPEGIAAAVSSARNGMKTLLIDSRDKLGGLWTVGGLNYIDMNYDPSHKLVTKGIFEEFYNRINESDSAKKLESFDIDEAEQIFQDLVGAEPNLVVKLQATQMSALKDGRVATGIVATDHGVRTRFYAKRLIDATQDAAVAAEAGAPYYVGMEDFNRPHECQPMTLIFEMGGVDWERMADSLMLARKKTGRGGANHVSGYGFLDIMQAYKHHHRNIAVRGLNVGRLKGDRVLINSVLIIGVDPLDHKARRQAMLEVSEELVPLTQYIVKHVPGFKHARLIGKMQELYVRESRHIVGQYRLSVNDAIENRDFPDKIALGSYPLDIQRTSLKNQGFVLGKPKAYSIPFRCLVPRRVDNLLAVGRCAGYDSLAHSSARTVPIGMATGQAAGVACAYSIRDSIPFKKISGSPEMDRIQETLREQGVRLDLPKYTCPYQDHWALHYIRFLRGMGMVSAGYRNDCRLSDVVPSCRVLKMTVKCEQRYFIARNTIPDDMLKLPAVNKNQAARMLLHMANVECIESAALEQLVECGMIRKPTAARVANSPKFNNALWYAMLHDYIDYRKATGVRARAPGPRVDKAPVWNCLVR